MGPQGPAGVETERLYRVNKHPKRDLDDDEAIESLIRMTYDLKRLVDEGIAAIRPRGASQAKAGQAGPSFKPHYRVVASTRSRIRTRRAVFAPVSLPASMRA